VRVNRRVASRHCRIREIADRCGKSGKKPDPGQPDSATEALRIQLLVDDICHAEQVVFIDFA